MLELSHGKGYKDVRCTINMPVLLMKKFEASKIIEMNEQKMLLTNPDFLWLLLESYPDVKD